MKYKLTYWDRYEERYVEEDYGALEGAKNSLIHLKAYDILLQKEKGDWRYSNFELIKFEEVDFEDCEVPAALLVQKLIADKIAAVEEEKLRQAKLLEERPMREKASRRTAYLELKKEFEDEI